MPRLINFFYTAQLPLAGQGLHTIEASRSHSYTRHSVGLLWTSDQPDAETSTWEHTTLTRDWHPRPPRGSNLQSQQVSGAAIWIGPPHQYAIECSTCIRHSPGLHPHSTSGPQALFYFWIYLFTSHVSVHVTGRHNIHAILHCNTVTTDIKRHWSIIIDSSQIIIACQLVSITVDPRCDCCFSQR
jgi:hypothetical protein